MKKGDAVGDKILCKGMLGCSYCGARTPATASELELEVVAAAVGVKWGGSATVATTTVAAVTAAEQRIGHFNAHNLANTAWAFAKADHLDA